MKRAPLFRELIHPLKTRHWCMRFWFAQRENSTELKDLEVALEVVRCDVDRAEIASAAEVEGVVLQALDRFYCGGNLTALEVLSVTSRKGVVSYFEW